MKHKEIIDSIILGLEVYIFPNWEYSYRTEDWKEHLMKDWKEIVVSENFLHFTNGEIVYIWEDWKLHLIKNGKEIANWITLYVYENGDYKYKDDNRIEHLIRNEKEIVNWLCVFPFGKDGYWYIEYDTEKKLYIEYGIKDNWEKKILKEIPISNDITTNEQIKFYKNIINNDYIHKTINNLLTNYENIIYLSKWWREDYKNIDLIYEYPIKFPM